MAGSTRLGPLRPTRPARSATWSTLCPPSVIRGQRASLYPRLLPLLDGLPNSLGGPKPKKGIEGRYVRVELRGQRRTLTLAEVEVFSDGRNIAPLGKASQKNTAYGGEAKRAIDGNKDDSYGDGGQTHTEENTANPWWEVDLGSEVPIESIAVSNRADGDLYKRLDRYTLKVLDARKTVVFEADNLPAPRVDDPHPGRRDRARRGLAALGDGRAHFGSGQGNRDLQSAREIRPRDGLRPRCRGPGDLQDPDRRLASRRGGADARRSARPRPLDPPE